MRIIAKKTLIAAWTKYAGARSALKAWHAEAVSASWKTPEDIRAAYPTVSIVGNNRVVFNIRGNTHRLIVAVKYAAGIVFIKFFGTHAEYDKINVEEIDHDH